MIRLDKIAKSGGLKCDLREFIIHVHVQSMYRSFVMSIRINEYEHVPLTMIIIIYNMYCMHRRLRFLSNTWYATRGLLIMFMRYLSYIEHACVPLLTTPPKNFCALLRAEYPGNYFSLQPPMTVCYIGTSTCTCI